MNEQTGGAARRRRRTGANEGQERKGERVLGLKGSKGSEGVNREKAN